MRLDSSLEEAFSVLQSFFHHHDRTLDTFSHCSVMALETPTAQTLRIPDRVQQQDALITPGPELRVRNPEPQNGNDCSAEASRSATQAIRQASQQASESIRQASQSASQASQQANQSASNEIRQAQNSASQSIAAASRSITSISSSASSALSSVQSSASQAIAQANSSKFRAEADASQAVLQAGAAIAAATGSAAAAGSSFLSSARQATGIRASLEAAASSQTANTNQQVSASQTAAVTATQAALAIVGSIIASTLLTILIFYLLARHRKAVKKRALVEKEDWPPRSPSPAGKSSYEPKFSFGDQNATTVAPSERSKYAGKIARRTGSDISLSMLFPRPPIAEEERSDITPPPVVKSTSVPWNPSRPPKAPTLSNWLKVQEDISPLGSIKLPMDKKSEAPLGGQLKSPHRTTYKQPAVKYANDLPFRSPKRLEIPEARQVQIISASRQPSTKVKKSRASPTNMPSPLVRQYKEAREAVWTDTPVSTALPQTSQTRRSKYDTHETNEGRYTPPSRGVRNTAEWAAAREALRTPESSRGHDNRPTFRISINQGLPSRPGPSRQRDSGERDGPSPSEYGYGAAGRRGSVAGGINRVVSYE